MLPGRRVAAPKSNWFDGVRLSHCRCIELSDFEAESVEAFFGFVGIEDASGKGLSEFSCQAVILASLCEATIQWIVYYFFSRSIQQDCGSGEGIALPLRQSYQIAHLRVAARTYWIRESTAWMGQAMQFAPLLLA